MSYCRTSEDSDVYVFGSFYAMECHISWRVAEKHGIEQSVSFKYKPDNDAEEKMLSYLLGLKRRYKIRVPGYAIRRLEREIAEKGPKPRPWKLERR